MTDMERKAVVKISRDLCLSCAHNPSIEECHLIWLANGCKEPFLYCKSVSARTSYDRLTGKCTCTSYQKKGTTSVDAGKEDKNEQRKTRDD